MRFMLFILTLTCCVSAMAQIPVAPSTAMRPDVYPSRQSAATALADQIADALSKAPTTAPTITLTYPSTNEPVFVSDLATALQSRMPSIPVVVEQIYRHRPTTAPTINISDNQNSSARSDMEGAYSAVLARPVSASLAVKFVDKPWADDWTTFVNTQPADSWIVGKTEDPSSTESEADQLARTDAARQIAPILLQRYPGIFINWDERNLTTWVSNQFLHDAGVHDKFLQRFDRPYGPVWRESILVGADSNTLAQMVVPLIGTANRQRDATFQPIAKTVVLVVVIILLYLFLNWITKGYFSTRLKIAGIALLAFVFVFVFLGLSTHRVVQVQTKHEDVQSPAIRR